MTGARFYLAAEDFGGWWTVEHSNDVCALLRKRDERDRGASVHDKKRDHMEVEWVDLAMDAEYLSLVGHHPQGARARHLSPAESLV